MFDDDVLQLSKNKMYVREQRRGPFYIKLIMIGIFW